MWNLFILDVLTLLSKFIKKKSYAFVNSTSFCYFTFHNNFIFVFTKYVIKFT